MVEEQNISEQNTLIALVTDNTSHNIIGVTSEDIRSWKTGHSSPTLEQIGAVTVFLLKQKRIFVSKDNHANAQIKVIRAKQINLRLSDDAVGADATLHEVIDEALDEVISFLE